jgi:ribosomal protein S18 acetylase RimI-like enzyme
MMRQDFSDALEPTLDSGAIREIRRGDQDEVLEFLSARPVHTVFMAGLIRDNGIISPQNRGSFYGFRNRFGQFEGVALIGHATMIEAHTEEALVAFAPVARNCQSAHLIRGEQASITTFWKYYAGMGRAQRSVSRELLYRLSEMPATSEAEVLRPATIEELDKIAKVNSSMAFEEGGVSPLQRDPNGFRHRTARRIEQGRIWTYCHDDQLIFKADVVSDTPDAIYLEGIYVRPEERRRGHGLRCLTELCSRLLRNSRLVCLTANERNKSAAALYARVGFQFEGDYETIYLR